MDRACSHLVFKYFYMILNYNNSLVNIVPCMYDIFFKKQIRFGTHYSSAVSVCKMCCSRQMPPSLEVKFIKSLMV